MFDRQRLVPSDIQSIGGRSNNRVSKVADMEEEVWDAVIADNLKGIFLGCRAAARERTRPLWDPGKRGLSGIHRHAGPNVIFDLAGC